MYIMEIHLTSCTSQFVAAEGDVQTKYTLATIAKTTKNSLEQVQVAVEAFPDAVSCLCSDLLPLLTFLLLPTAYPVDLESSITLHFS